MIGGRLDVAKSHIEILLEGRFLLHLEQCVNLEAIADKDLCQIFLNFGDQLLHQSRCLNYFVIWTSDEYLFTVTSDFNFQRFLNLSHRLPLMAKTIRYILRRILYFL
jgi:hypothetical protein